MGRGLTAALHEHRYVQVLASDLAGVALERAIARTRPRVVIFDEGVDHAFLMGLVVRHPATGLVVFAHRPVHVLGTALLAAGITCLASGASLATALEALHCAALGEPLFFCLDGSRVARGGLTVADVLTPRERAVFVLLSDGASYAAIALEMQISIETVRTHAASIRRKLGVQRKYELVGMQLSSRLEKTAR
jgi:DNA-binding NarL/FixJ family response regulator